MKDIHATVFGLDYDNTTARDIDGWLMFIKLMKARGHSVFIVTMRFPSEIHGGANTKFTPMDPEILAAVDGVFTTCRMAKKPYMEAQGIKVTVWIDDEPRAINNSAHEIWPNVTPEGEVVALIHD